MALLLRIRQSLMHFRHLTYLLLMLLLSGAGALIAQQSPVREAKATSKVTLYVSGVECPSCVYAVTYSIGQLKGIGEVTAGQIVENYVNVQYDPKEVTVGKIAQAVLTAPALHGTPYQPALKIQIPAYAQPENRARVDALWKRWKGVLEPDLIDQETGEFVLYFSTLPTPENSNAHSAWTLDELKQALSAPAPQGLGLALNLMEEKDPE